MIKNPVCTILWQEAAYSFEKEVPSILPNLRLTTGFIIESNSEYTFIATNVDYDSLNKTLTPVDGFVIPEKAIVNFRKIGNYEE